MEHQHIEDLDYDLIVLSTGLIETIIASAAAADGKQVLVLDSNPFYGGMWANLNLRQLYDVLCEACKAGANGIEDGSDDDDASPSATTVAIGRAPPCISNVYISAPLDEQLASSSSAYSIDLAPKVLFCQGPSMQLLLKATVYNYLEFKLLGASHIWQQGKLHQVPASRADVFQNKELSLEEKRQLMRFLKHATQEQHGAAQQHTTTAATEEPPLFTQYLTQQGLTGPMHTIALHAIAHTAASHHPNDTPLTPTQGMAAVKQYIQSIGVYGPASSPFLASMYGSGEYAQAFSRLAAVKGATFVLRRGVAGLVVDDAEGVVCGVRTSEGQVLRGRRVVGNVTSQLGGDGGEAGKAGVSSAAAASHPAAVTPPQQPSSSPSSTFRCIAIIEGVLPALGAVVDVGCVVVFPPGAGGLGSPRVWGVVLGPGLGVCPHQRQLVYLTCSAPAPTITTMHTPHSLLQPILGLLTQPPSTPTSNTHVEHTSSSSSPPSSSLPSPVVWSAYYQQQDDSSTNHHHDDGAGVVQTPSMHAKTPKGLVLVPGPDASVHMDDAVVCAGQVYAALFDGAQLFQGMEASSLTANDDSDEELMGAVHAALSIGGEEG